MALAASCDGLYFPSEPRDNVITLRWKAQEAPMEPHTSVVFKVKCTAPHLFHVLPRYGAILLSDATGTVLPGARQSTTITFGLREHHEGEDGSVTPSAANRPSTVTTTRTSRASSASPGGPAYQERFSIEYVVIKSESLAFQQIMNALTDAARLTEVSKNIWALIASGAIPRAHLGAQAGISLKVYMENVVLQRSDPVPIDEATKIVVPPEAHLEPPGTSSRHHGARAGANGSGDGRTPSARGRGEAAVGGAADRPSGSPSSTRRKPADELRALKEEINTMRRETATPGSATAGSTRNNSGSPSPNNHARVAASATAAAAEPLSAPAERPAAAGVENAADLVMRFDRAGPAGGGAGAAKQGKGMKVSRVLLAMFVLYISLLWMRRGVTHAPAGSSGAIAPAAAEAVGREVQVSSREVERPAKKSKGKPL